MQDTAKSLPIKANTKHEIVEIIQANRERFAEFGVSEIGLFGSFVREEANEESDIDLLVNLSNHGYENFCQLIDFTQSLFEGRKVDLITEDSINEINGIYICKEVEYVVKNER